MRMKLREIFEYNMTAPNIFKKYFQKIFLLGRDELSSATKCLFPCNFLEYKESISLEFQLVSFYKTHHILHPQNNFRYKMIPTCSDPSFIKIRQHCGQYIHRTQFKFSRRKRPSPASPSWQTLAAFSACSLDLTFSWSGMG